MKIFSTVQTKALALKICKALDVPLNVAKTNTFSDGEKSTQLEDSVRGQRVFIIGATGNDSIMETLLMIDAAKRAAAESIVAVIPYFGYARQDRKEGVRGPIGAKLVADLLTTAGAKEIVSIDLHAAQIQGFFNIPFDHIEGHTIFTQHLQELINESKVVPFDRTPEWAPPEWLICTPDAGGFLRASKFAEKLNLSMVAINKHRDKANSIGSMELVGNVFNKNIIIIDDIFDTCNTLKCSVDLLLSKGAREVLAVATHGVFSGPAIKNLIEIGLTELFISDSLQNLTLENISYINSKREEKQKPPLKITKVSCDKCLATFIKTITEKGSLERCLD